MKIDDMIQMGCIENNCKKKDEVIHLIHMVSFFRTIDPASFLGRKDLLVTFYFRFRVKESARSFFFLAWFDALR